MAEDAVRACGNGAPDPRRHHRAIGFFLSFGFAKIAIYCVPLAVAAISPAEVYGGMEMAYAVTLLVATALISAPLHGLSHGYLVQKRREVVHRAAILVLGGCLFALATALLSLLAGVDPDIILILAVSGVTSAQIVFSFLLRITGRASLLAWTDGLVLLLGVALVVMAKFIADRVTLGIVVAGYLIATTIIAAGAAAVLRRGPVRNLRRHFREDLRIGTSMAAYALFSTWMAVAGRILIGIAAPADLPAFGIAFRIAGIAIGVQLLATTALWNRMYMLRTRAADALLAWLLGATLVTAVIISLGGGFVIAYLRFEAVSGSAASLAVELVPPVTLMVFFWASHNLLQARINRLRVSRHLIWPLVLLSVSGVVAIFAAHLAGAPTLVLAWLLALYSAGYFCASWLALARRGLPHRRTGAMSLIGGLILAAIALA